MGVRPGPFRSRGESHVGATGEQLLDQIGGEVDFDLEPDVRHIGLQPRDEGGKATRRRDLARADPNHPVRLAIAAAAEQRILHVARSEEHTSEFQSLMRISYAVFCLKKKKQSTRKPYTETNEQI